MSKPDFDPRTLSVEERPAPMDAELVAELHRRVEAFSHDPSNSIRWEDLRAELGGKYG